MASILFCEKSLQSLKRYLRDDFFEVKSSHLTEAIAVSLGYGKHAALLSDLKLVGDKVVYRLLSTTRFMQRLCELGYPADPEFDFEWMVGATDVPDCLISTVPSSAYDIEYNGKRATAWRNLMVAAVNEGLRIQLFSLKPDDNRWHVDRFGGGSAFYDFELPGGLGARGCVSDAGFGELNVHVAVNPKGNALAAFNADFFAGDAVALGWLERRDGAWLQSSKERFSCRTVLLDSLSAMTSVPEGYGDRGGVRL